MGLQGYSHVGLASQDSILIRMVCPAIIGPWRGGWGHDHSDVLKTPTVDSNLEPKVDRGWSHPGETETYLMVG